MQRDYSFDPLKETTLFGGEYPGDEPLNEAVLF
ncbi:hypothetical protein SAEN111111_09800 [Saccharibacillus endophyticus]